jgi:hypothetical protein
MPEKPAPMTTASKAGSLLSELTYSEYFNVPVTFSYLLGRAHEQLGDGYVPRAGVTM